MSRDEPSQGFWPPSLPDSFDPPGTRRGDPDENEKRRRQLEDEYWDLKRNQPKSIGGLLGVVSKRIRRQAIR